MCGTWAEEFGAAERDAGDDRGRQVLPASSPPLPSALSQQSVYFRLSGKRVQLVRPGPVVSGGKTVRLTGPGGRAQDRQPECSGKPTGRVQQRGEGAGLRILQRGADDLRVIVLNKWDATQLTLDVPEQMDCVSAMVLSGESVWDTAPEYRSLFAGCEAVTGGSYTGSIPGREPQLWCTRSAPARWEKRPGNQVAEPRERAGGCRGRHRRLRGRPWTAGETTALPYRPTQTFPHLRSIHTQA